MKIFLRFLPDRIVSNVVKVITAEWGDVNNGITSISSFDEPCIFRFFNEEASQQWREKEVNAQFADTKIIGSLMIFALYAIGNANQRRKRCQIYPEEPMLCP